MLSSLRCKVSHQAKLLAHGNSLQTEQCSPCWVRQTKGTLLPPGRIECTQTSLPESPSGLLSLPGVRMLPSKIRPPNPKPYRYKARLTALQCPECGTSFGSIEDRERCSICAQHPKPYLNPDRMSAIHRLECDTSFACDRPSYPCLICGLPALSRSRPCPSCLTLLSDAMMSNTPAPPSLSTI